MNILVSSCLVIDRDLLDYLETGGSGEHEVSHKEFQCEEEFQKQEEIEKQEERRSRKRSRK